MKLFKKKDESHEEAEATVAEPRGLSSARLVLMLFLASSLAAAAAGYLAYGRLASQADRIQLQKQVAVAERAAARIEGRLAALHEMLGTVASDEKLITALQEGDRAGLGEMLEQYREHFVGALSLRLLAPSQSEPDPALKPALGYACLEQAAQAASGGHPLAQVHRYGSEDQHIDIIHPVRDGEALLAHLQLTLDVALPPSWLQVPSGAQVELRQQVAGASLLLGEMGNPGLKGREPLHSAPIGGSSWQLLYRNDYQGLLPEAERFGFVAIFGVQIALLALIAVVFSVLLSRLLHADLKGLVSYFIATLKNERTHSSALRLREFQKAAHGLDGYVAKHPIRPRELHLGAQPAPESGISVEEAADEAAEAEEDSLEADLPDVMFMDSQGISLEELGSSDSKDNEGQK